MESKTWVEHRKSLGCFSFVSRHGAVSWGAGQEAGAAGPGLECMLPTSPLGMRRPQRRRGWVGPPRFLRHPSMGMCCVCVHIRVCAGSICACVGCARVRTGMDGSMYRSVRTSKCTEVWAGTCCVYMYARVCVCVCVCILVCVPQGSSEARVRLW